MITYASPANISIIAENDTLIENCKVGTCPLDLASIDYVPSLPGNIIFLAIFAIVLIIQVPFGIRYRTWSFLAGIIGGQVLEILGYVARVQMHDNPFKSDPFLLYIVTLTIAPCFLTASIYVCLSRVITVYGTDKARFTPHTYTYIFIGCDIFSLVLQAVGGALADTADTHSESQKGINIMIAGLAFQVVSLTVFIALCSDYAWSVVKKGRKSTAELASRLAGSPATFYLFMICESFSQFSCTLICIPHSILTQAAYIAIGIATFTIYVRSIYRVAELQGGFDGHLANDQTTFIILESVMVAIASVALTIPHPGLVFGKNWNLKKAQEALGGDGPVEKIEGA
ncbi:MAG: hypothetical protein LQ351_005665 [Letrouitia transgressa]|nr:MAG: hypothetical protein LQ351_005665 [Letrouitia transgressa]